MRNIEELIKHSIINLNKPTDLTSSEVVIEIKKIFGLKKCGHTGTLDPRVTGVLVIALENAIKIMPVLMNLDKEYEGIMYLHKNIHLKKLKDTISKNFLGEITQIPPVKSHVSRKPRKRIVYSFDIIKKDGKNVYFKTRVQAGTYIRKLCSDIGKKLGTGAQMKRLKRTRVGHFRLKNSHELDEIRKSFKNGNEALLRKILIPIEKAIPHVKRVYVKDTKIDSICKGKPVLKTYIIKTKGKIKPREIVGIFSSKDELIALGIVNTRKDGLTVRTDRVIRLNTS